MEREWSFITVRFLVFESIGHRLNYEFSIYVACSLLHISPEVTSALSRFIG